MKVVNNHVSTLVPHATVFLASGCVMVLEIVATRLIARYLGASLYTWTSVICIVLAGITIGNYLGGRISDRYSSKNVIGLIFAISSASCVATIVLNNILGNLDWLRQMTLPMRVFIHTGLVFIIPSVLLGMISPVVAKMALDQGKSTGRTIGGIYACGAAGSILGTFLAGFYLIPIMGTVNIIWMISAVLFLMAVGYGLKRTLTYVGALMFICLVIPGTVPTEWAERTGIFLGLRKVRNPNIIYETESQYSYIVVRKLDLLPELRQISVDNMEGGNIVIMDDVTNLYSFYMRAWAVVTRGLSKTKGQLSVLMLGGGGYVYPQYIEAVWPDSLVDVVEIDPKMTDAAFNAFGLSENTGINIITMDARNWVHRLEYKLHKGDEIQKYDFVYGDAYHSLSVPHHLLTREFNEKIDRILSDDGVYMLNIIDNYKSGRLLGAVINTIKETFPYLRIVSDIKRNEGLQNFILIASNHEIDCRQLFKALYPKNEPLWMLTDSDIKGPCERANRIVLTDDYAPVDNLLAPAVATYY